MGKSVCHRNQSHCWYPSCGNGTVGKSWTTDLRVPGSRPLDSGRFSVGRCQKSYSIPRALLDLELFQRISESFLKPRKTSTTGFELSPILTVRSVVQRSNHYTSDCSCQTTAKLCNLCEEHVNVINTVADPDSNPSTTQP